MKKVKELIVDVPDFPQPGIIFRDITPVLADSAAFARVIDRLAERYASMDVSHFVGIESRGFIFATALAYKMGKGFIPVRKKGKLPRDTFAADYSLEYGTDSVHIHQDSLGADDRAVIVDDLIATGGTASAARHLVEQCGALALELAVVVELTALSGRDKLAGLPVHSLVTY